MTTTEPFIAHVGEPRRPLAGFIDADSVGLPPDQAAALRSLAVAERQEERARQERLAERMEAANNMALAEAAMRAHAAGRPWDPSNPLEFYPTREQRVSEAFAVMDVQAASELRQAKAAAAKVLREHGVHAQIVIDANATESPHPVASAGSSPPASRAEGLSSSMPVGAARAGIVDKIRGARIRWASPKRAHRSGPTAECGCAACNPGSVRSDGGRPLDHGHEVTRSHATEPRIR